MIRWVIAIALSWSAWGFEQPSAALARAPMSSDMGAAMCGDGAQTLHPQDLAPGQVFALEERAGGASVDRRVSETSDDGQPAWCVSPDDPRCAPRDQGAPLQGQRLSAPLHAAASLQYPRISAPRSVPSRRATQLGAPCAGIALRVERPPRA